MKEKSGEDYIRQRTDTKVGSQRPQRKNILGKEQTRITQIDTNRNRVKNFIT
ncbi:MAG: hypothetical protein ACOYN6_09550 [Ignavibacteria bacterium]